MDKNYTVYHLHTDRSLLDSCTNYKLFIDKAAELGQTAIAFSEHGNTYNWIEKKMYANEKGLKYIHACEVYLTETLTEKIRDNYHTVLVAKNYEGVQELNSLIDLSTQESHFYYKPRITFDEFFSISDNIIKISACLASPLSKYPTSENADKDVYEELLRAYDYYEVQPHNNADQIRYNSMLYIASKKYNKPLIAGTDTHSLDSYKAECRSILQKAKKITYSDEDSFDLTYKSYEELVEMFKQQAALPIDVILEAIENTNRMADSVEEFELDKSFKYPVLYDDEEMVLRKRISDMYQDKINKGAIQPDHRYMEMVEEEMRVFKKIGMVGFMLFMSELVSWCWENNIPVGFCRGSVGGSMVAYLTDIIDVNPLKWNTVFSRFCNENRKEIGDIDVDISPTQRHLVYEHIIEKFGLDKTAYVLAIGTISDKGTIDEIGRALSDKWFADNKKYQNELKEIKKKIKELYQNGDTNSLYGAWSTEQCWSYRQKEFDLGNPYSLSNIARIKKEYDEDPDKTKEKYPDIFYYFEGLVNTAISQSMHPAGIICSPVTLVDNYGTFWSDGKRILSINMEEIHEISLVKYDILGLKNVEIIKDCCKLAGIKYPKSHEIDWNDKDVWEHIVDSPVGIFQFESKFAFESLKKMGCYQVNDLSLVNASIRPSGESYRDRLLNREENKNPSEMIDELLKDNKGFLVFQEDTIKFLTEICGLSGSEADNIRRAIGRKQKDRLEEAMPSILEGYCSKSSKSREVAEEEAKAFLQIIEDSSNYQFGFNHSTGYSMIGYLCGYLRYYYPKEFITAYLNNANNEDDINMGTELAKQLNIKIQPIKFRHSIAEYSCDSNGVYKGISSIKFCNEKIASELYELRDKQYNSFIDLLIDVQQTTVNSRQLEILIKLDFFQEFGEPRKLLKQLLLFNNLYGKKQFKKDKLDEIGVDEEVLKRYALETDKMYKNVDTQGLLNELVSSCEYPKTTISDYIKYQLEHLGYVEYLNPEFTNRHIVVTDLDTTYSPKIKAYCLKNGQSCEMKIHKKRNPRDKSVKTSFNDVPLENGDIIYMDSCTKKPRQRKNADGEWEIVPGEFNWWIDSYSIVNL